MKGKAGIRLVQIENDSQDNKVSTASKDYYWSWTFGITSFPFFFWGCPFYLLIGRTLTIPGHAPSEPIRSTRAWWMAIFNCCSVPFSSIISLLLLAPTIGINGYVAYVFGDIFNSLFIAGTYKLSSLIDILDLIRYLPILVPLDYVWFRGFKINNVVCTLNKLCRKHEGIGCGLSFRIRIIVMIIAVVAVHIIRYFCYEKYEISGKKNVWKIFETMMEFSLDIFSSFLLPLYCFFCYAIMFQLYIIKAYIYQLIGRRALPNILHLSVVKTLYTQVADCILQINQIFSLYLSAALLIMIIGTIIDAQSMWKGIAKLFGNLSGPWMSLILLLAGQAEEAEQQEGGASKTPLNQEWTSTDVREFNGDIACIMIIYGMIYFTIRQAIATNDCVRELNVWLNDFITGGGGTDVANVLQSLGALKSGKGVSLWHTNEDSDGFPLVWAKSSMMENGMDDEFLRKFRNLKAYIHVRMQVEKPALLQIALVGLLAPSLGGRLRQYRIVF